MDGGYGRSGVATRKTVMEDHREGLHRDELGSGRYARIVPEDIVPYLHLVRSTEQAATLVAYDGVVKVYRTGVGVTAHDAYPSIVSDEVIGYQ